jgi:hypothetical protein
MWESCGKVASKNMSLSDIISRIYTNLDTELSYTKANLEAVNQLANLLS